MLVGIVKLALAELCHPVIVPVWPDKVNAVTAPPEQMVWSPLAVPPTAKGSTVTTNGVANASGQEAEVNTALKARLTVNTPGLKVVLVLEMSVHAVKGETEVCHLSIVPVCPDKVNVPGELLKHTLLIPVITPPTGAGFTVIVAALEFATGQLPF